MFGNLYNNPYANSNLYTDSTSNSLPGTTTGNFPPIKVGENDFLSLIPKPPAKAIIPMIIKHIHEAVIEEDTAYLFMGMEVREVEVVGIVSGSQKGPRYDFTISDGTGSIQAKLFVGQSNADMDIITVGYARIIGSLTSNNGIHSLSIYHMDRIDNFNTVILHYLNVFQAYLYYKSKQSPKVENSSEAKPNAIDATPSDASNTVEMLVKQGFRSLQERNPSGVPVTALTEHLKQFGVSKEQVDSVLGDLERKMEIIATDVNEYLLNDM